METIVMLIAATVIVALAVLVHGFLRGFKESANRDERRHDRKRKLWNYLNRCGYVLTDGELEDVIEIVDEVIY